LYQAYASEWVTHQHRDTLSSIVGHPPLLAYISIADGECQARERYEVIEVSRTMVQC
jgi:splicing factor 3B subunit 5